MLMFKFRGVTLGIFRAVMETRGRQHGVEVGYGLYPRAGAEWTGMAIEGRIPDQALIEWGLQAGFLRLKGQNGRALPVYYVAVLSQAAADRANTAHPSEQFGPGAYVLELKELKHYGVPAAAVAAGPFFYLGEAHKALTGRAVTKRVAEVQHA